MRPNGVVFSPFKSQLIWREKQLWLSWGFHDFRRIFWIVSILLQQWLYLYIWWCISNVIKFWYTHFHFSIKKISFLSISLSLSLFFYLLLCFSSSLSFLCNSLYFLCVKTLQFSIFYPTELAKHFDLHKQHIIFFIPLFPTSLSQPSHQT